MCSSDLSHLESHMSIELDWLNRHHPDAAHFVPENMRPMYLNKLVRVASPMTDEERRDLECLEIYGQKEE